MPTTCVKALHTTSGAATGSGISRTPTQVVTAPARPGARGQAAKALGSVAVMRVTGIDHVVFNVSDVEQSVTWWCDLIGLEPVRLDEWRRGEVPFVSVRISPSTIIDLFARGRSGENVNHIALQVA